MPTPLAVILIAAVPAVAQPRTGARPATTAQHPRAAAPTQGPVVPNPWPELASKLRAKGCELVEARPTKDEAGRILRSLGLIETPAKFYRVKADDKGAVVVAVCESAQAARAMVQKRLPPGTPYAIWRNVLIVRSGTNDHWGQLTDALEPLGVEHGATPTVAPEGPSDARSATRHMQLMALRAQLEIYKLRHDGAMPDFNGRQWEDLVAQKYVNSPPRNPFSPDPVAAKVVAAKSGSSLDPKVAGWGFDAERGMLFAAGSDE